MKLYVWRSDLLKNYSSGWLIAQGTSADEARVKLRAGFAAWYVDRYPWIGTDDADDIAEREECRKLLELDISGDPVEQDFIFIQGSE
jgi:hypothetical protein